MGGDRAGEAECGNSSTVLENGGDGETKRFMRLSKSIRREVGVGDILIFELIRYRLILPIYLDIDTNFDTI